MMGRAGHSEAYKRYLICSKFKWDFYTYEQQPTWFIDELMIILNQEAQQKSREAKKASRGSSNMTSGLGSMRRPHVRKR